MHIDRVHRPLSDQAEAPTKQHQCCKPPYFDNPDKGRCQALEHFAQCLLEEAEPQTADGASGARSTQIGLALLESLKQSQPVDYAEFKIESTPTQRMS